MKTSLGVLNKIFVSIKLDSRVTLVRVKSARVTSIWIGPLHKIATFDEFVYVHEKKKHSQQLVYVALSRAIFNKLFNIIRVG